MSHPNAIFYPFRRIGEKRDAAGYSLPHLTVTGAILALAAGFLILSSRLSAQVPVTGGEDLIGHVRRLKSLGSKVHLEWLYLEDSLDRLPEQQALVRSDRPLEFTEGFLYHGRDGLDDALLKGSVQGTSYFTRAPHVWAIGPFHEGSRSPAIFIIQALDFNLWRDSGKAALEAEIDKTAGIMDPYPKVLSEIPLSSVAEIWTDEDTGERYGRLLETPGSELSSEELRLKEALRRWSEKGKFVVLRGLRHRRLDLLDFFPAAYEIVGGYFMERGLVDRMPKFRIRKSLRNSQTPPFSSEFPGPYLSFPRFS